MGPRSSSANCWVSSLFSAPSYPLFGLKPTLPRAAHPTRSLAGPSGGAVHFLAYPCRSVYRVEACLLLVELCHPLLPTVHAASCGLITASLDCPQPFLLFFPTGFSWAALTGQTLPLILETGFASWWVSAERYNQIKEGERKALSFGSK